MPSPTPTLSNDGELLRDLERPGAGAGGRDNGSDLARQLERGKTPSPANGANGDELTKQLERPNGESSVGSPGRGNTEHKVPQQVQTIYPPQPSIWPSVGAGVIDGIKAGAVSVAVSLALAAALPPVAATSLFYVLAAAGAFAIVYDILWFDTWENVGYNAGVLAGSALIGSGFAYGVAWWMSPVGDKPARGLRAFFDLAKVWRTNAADPGTRSFFAHLRDPRISMAKGPSKAGVLIGSSLIGAGAAGMATRQDRNQKVE